MSFLVRLGRIVKIKNWDKKKFSHENEYYNAVIIKDELGHKKTLLFTDKELERAAERAYKNIETVDIKQSSISKLLD